LRRLLLLVLCGAAAVEPVRHCNIDIYVSQPFPFFSTCARRTRFEKAKAIQILPGALSKNSIFERLWMAEHQDDELALALHFGSTMAAESFFFVPV
jgi:hypothetical protein